MAKLNALCSVKHLGESLVYTAEGKLVKRQNVMVTFRNDKKKGEILIQSKVKIEQLSFSLLGSYFVKLYELAVRFDCDIYKALEYAGSKGIDEECMIEHFHRAVKATEVLERVYGDKLVYFIFSFSDLTRNHAYGKHFPSGRAKRDYFIEKMKERTLLN